MPIQVSDEWHFSPDLDSLLILRMGPGEDEEMKLLCTGKGWSQAVGTAEGGEGREDAVGCV